MEITRKEYHTLKKRINEKRKFIQVIVGPRQVGKTTLVNQLMQKEPMLFYYSSADDELAVKSIWITEIWEAARIKLQSSNKRQLVLIIDEVQKVPDWSSAVKKEWDKDTRLNINIKVVLLGSSSLLINKGLNESLAGRFEVIYLKHWSYAEVKEAFNVSPEQFLWFGGYPGAYSLIKNESRWKEYIKASLIETTISKDILLLNRVDKPALLRNLFELGCSYSGQMLSYTKLLGQLQNVGNTTTLAHYLRLLDKAWLLTGLEKFTSQKFRQRASSPKFQVFNTALQTALLGKSFAEVRRIPDEWGRIVESAIGAHLINHSETSGFRVFYWRKVNLEVDFILQFGDKIIAIEVKSGRKIIKQGIEHFQKEFNPHKTLLIGSTGIPWHEFLTIDPIELF
jgi:predicted AAA+ superfamily ATPase